MSFIYVEFSDPIGDYFEAEGATFSTQHRPLSGGIRHRSQLNGFVVKKAIGYMSETLFQHCMAGTTFPWARVEFYTTAESGLTFLYTLSSVQITSIQASGSSETIGLDFTSFSPKNYAGEG